MHEGNSGGGRQALHWEHETTLCRNEVRCDITSASFGGDRRGYSVVIARQMDERVSKFLRPQDVDDLVELLVEVKDFLDAAKAGDQRAR